MFWGSAVILPIPASCREFLLIWWPSCQIDRISLYSICGWYQPTIMKVIQTKHILTILQWILFKIFDRKMIFKITCHLIRSSRNPEACVDMFRFMPVASISNRFKSAHPRMAEISLDKSQYLQCIGIKMSLALIGWTRLKVKIHDRKYSYPSIFSLNARRGAPSLLFKKSSFSWSASPLNRLVYLSYSLFKTKWAI